MAAPEKRSTVSVRFFDGCQRSATCVVRLELPGAGSIGVGSGSVAANDLDAGMLLESHPTSVSEVRSGSKAPWGDAAPGPRGSSGISSRGARRSLSSSMPSTRGEGYARESSLLEHSAKQGRWTGRHAQGRSTSRAAASPPTAKPTSRKISYRRVVFLRARVRLEERRQALGEDPPARTAGLFRTHSGIS